MNYQDQLGFSYLNHKGYNHNNVVNNEIGGIKARESSHGFNALWDYMEVNAIESVSLKVLIPINWLINPRIFM